MKEGLANKMVEVRAEEALECKYQDMGQVCQRLVYRRRKHIKGRAR